MKKRIIPRNRQQNTMEGFTIIEIIVTIVVLGIFLAGFFQVYLGMEAQRVFLSRSARASNIAYTNLRKVSSRPSQITAQVCSDNASVMDLTNSSQSAKPGLDITQYGYTLEPDANIKTVLGSDATQTLVAYAPHGCSALATDPLEIVSIVTFKGNKVTHAALVQ